jgi:hypothetical protein
LAIKALKPRKIRYYVSDGRGLWLEVFPGGGSAWRYRYRLNGRLEKIALGRYPQMTLKAARLKRDELSLMVGQGLSPTAEKQLAKHAMAKATTMRELPTDGGGYIPVPNQLGSEIDRIVRARCSIGSNRG